MIVKNFILIPVFIFLINFISFSQTGGAYELNSIDFEGNDQFSSSTLSYVIYSEESPGWFWQFLNSFTSFGEEAIYFDSTEIQIDLRALKDYYNANGFFESEFSYKYTVDTSDKDIDLTYLIKENEPSTYGKIKIEGLKKIPPYIQNFVDVDLSVDTTERYMQVSFQEKVEKGLNSLLNSGFMLAKFDSSIITKDTVRNKADIEVYFTPNKLYKIDSLIVKKDGEGAEYVEEDLLKKITGIKAGDIYNLENIRQSQVRLFRTGLFNSVILSAEEKDTSDSKVPLKLSGNIGLMNELSPEIILNNQNKALNIGLSASYIRKNFLGEARKLTISPSFGLQEFFKINFEKVFKKFSIRDTTLLGYVDARIAIEQPYLFGKPIFGRWENYAQIIKQRNFNLTNYGTRLSMEFELPKFTFINFLSTFYSFEVNKENYLQRDSLSSKLISSVGADLGRTTVDNILFPTLGYNLSFQFEEANFLPYTISKIFKSNFDEALFYKMVLSGSFYFALNPRRTQIFAVKAKIGHLQTYIGDYAGVPISRTFFVGGSNSVRGWSSNELTPPNAPEIENLVEGVVNIKGGTFLFEGSFEYRYKFFDNFGTALFFDYGNTWIGYKRFRFDEIALAAGFGFRYYTQIAPFRIDFGFKVYDPKDKKTIINKAFWKQMEFHFGIGEAF